MLELYEFAISGNCHKVRMMLSFLRQDYKSYPVNGAAGEQKTPGFIAKNPFGQVPVLVDGATVLRDSQAILVYLAKRYGGATWMPEDAVGMSRTVAWLSIAANEISRGPGALRSHFKFGRVVDIDEANKITNAVLEITNSQLIQSEWLIGEKLTIADLAIYPYLALAHEGKVVLTPFTAIQRWMQKIQALPNFVSMPGIL